MLVTVGGKEGLAELSSECLLAELKERGWGSGGSRRPTELRAMAGHREPRPTSRSGGVWGWWWQRCSDARVGAGSG
jgi:hypothetical protein